MEQAFDGFLRDLERGLELIPEIIVEVLPEFIQSLIKVISVDMPKVLAIDIPVAIVKGIFLALPAFINELGFLFADVVNKISELFSGIQSIIDTLKAIREGDFEFATREERQERRRSNVESRLPGITAAVESVRNFASGGKFLPSAAGGMRFTGSSRQGLAMLHQNEFVVPASGQRPQAVDRQMSNMGGNGINIVINSQVVEQNAIDSLVRQIEERFNSNFGMASSNLFGGR
jgi:hypothetical protein